MKIQFVSEFEDGQLLYNHCVKLDQKQQDYRSHYHDMYEILFLKSGSVSYQADAEIFPLRKNMLVLTRPQQLHCIQINDDSPYDRYDLLFPRDMLPQTLFAKIPDDLHTVSFEANQLVIQLFEKMDYYCERLSGEELGRMLRGLAEEIIMNIVIHVSAKGRGGNCDRHPLTERALTYIEKNLLSIRDIEEICAELAVSKSYLYQLFLNDLDTTPKRYIVQRRLNLARREIVLGAKATAIYEQCGFTDYSAFFRAYKKHFGYPPIQTQQSSLVRISYNDVVRGYSE